MAFFAPPRYQRHRRGGENVFVMMLFAQLLQRIQQLPYKPPVTLFLMALMAAIHWAPEILNLAFPHVRSTLDFAFNPYLIVEGQEWHRLWMSALVHANAMHLYYNLSSFLYKGVALESILGESFALVVGVLTILSQTIFFGLSWLASTQGFDSSAWITNTVGFSGTLFALKVLVNSLDEGPAGLSFSHFFRLDLPWRKIVWVELLIAQFMVPGASFLGHLSGILAGILFLPLFSFMIGGGNSFLFYHSEPRFRGSGTASRAPPVPQPQAHRVPPPEARRAPPPPPQAPVEPRHRNPPSPQRRPELVPSGHPLPAVAPELSAEELRRRRLARFGA